MKPYKVLVVDDSAFMRKLVSDFISEDPRFQIISTARDGLEALEKVEQLQPDVITMDVEMPKMNGLEALRIIMAQHPTPVVMLSSLTYAGADETIKALEWGAVDFVQKPSGSISLDLYKVKSELQSKVQTAVLAKVRKTAARPAANDRPPLPPRKMRSIRDEKADAGEPRSRTFEHLVAIGTSTGGPKALQEVITRLPGNFPAPIVIVQHMPPHFTRSLAQRLDSISEVRVKEAEDNDVLETGTAYIAPGGFHMKIKRDQGYRIQLSEEEPRRGHRPSVDHLFESLLPYKELKRHLVLMTGMGNDGAWGMKELKEAGAVTCIAESEQTCVVYGMPRSAVELGCVDHILPLDAIAGQLLQVTTKQQ